MGRSNRRWLGLDTLASRVSQDEFVTLSSEAVHQCSGSGRSGRPGRTFLISPRRWILDTQDQPRWGTEKVKIDDVREPVHAHVRAVV
jgi:hypothetical protein